MREQNMKKNYYYDINCFKGVDESKIEVLESLFPYLTNEYSNMEKDYANNNIISYIQVTNQEGINIAIPYIYTHKKKEIDNEKYILKENQDYCLVTIKPKIDEDLLMSFIYTPDNHILMTKDGKNLLTKQYDCTIWNGIADFYKNRPSKTVKKVLNRLL